MADLKFHLLSHNFIKNVRFYLFMVYMIAIDEIFHLNYHLEHSEKVTYKYLFLQIEREPVKLSTW